MKFINKLKRPLCNIKLMPYIIVLTILLLSVGYSSFSSNLSVRDLYAQVRLQKDIRVTGISVVPGDVDTQSGVSYIDYNVSNIQAGIKLPNLNSNITFNVVVTNIGSAEVGIKEITGLPDNLDYEILNYNLKDKICDENNVCKLGIQKEMQVQIKYKEGGYDSSNTQYNVVANLNFQPFYTVSYRDIEGSGYPTEILGTETLTVDFGTNAPKKISIKINDAETTGYTYENGILTVPNVSGNVEIVKYLPTPKSFAEDSWDTIIANVQEGNIAVYQTNLVENQNNTKQITLTSEDEDIAGTYTVRIANASTPEECSTQGYSKTSCGFVIEFVDLISTVQMNDASTNVGGWEASLLRPYVNSVIYESMPQNIRDSIIDTYVVSGHGSTAGEENFVTIDKLYLLTGKEVYGEDEYDTAADFTRQLDYYSNLKITQTNKRGAAKKNNGSAQTWWLRSGRSNNPTSFRVVYLDGVLSYGAASNSYGLSVAFRINE